jgi:hypothetical protein
LRILARTEHAAAGGSPKRLRSIAVLTDLIGGNVWIPQPPELPQEVHLDDRAAR